MKNSIVSEYVILCGRREFEFDVPSGATPIGARTKHFGPPTTGMDYYTILMLEDADPIDITKQRWFVVNTGESFDSSGKMIQFLGSVANGNLHIFREITQ